jgi:hypothetical protein
MSPALSWAVFLICIAIGATVYIVVAGGHRYRRMEREALDHDWPTMLYPAGPPMRVIGGIYDHEARGDFHDPIRDHEWCPDCNARLRRAFNDLADLDLGPRDVDALMARIREVLDS